MVWCGDHSFWCHTDSNWFTRSFQKYELLDHPKVKSQSFEESFKELIKESLKESLTESLKESL